MRAPDRVAVLLVTDARSPRDTRAGVEPLSRSLDRVRFHPWIVCEPHAALDGWADERRREGTPVERLPAIRHRLDLARALAWYRFFRRRRGALLHVVHGTPGSARYVVPIAHLAGVRAVLVTEEVARSARSIGQRWLKRWEMSRADVCVAARAEIAESLSGALDVARELFDLVAPGVAAAPPLAAIDRRRARTRLGVPETMPLWAALGVGPAEIGALRAAWSELEPPRPALAVVAAAGGAGHTVGAFDDGLRLVAEEDECTLLAVCDAAVVPPAGGAVPVALFEAMAAGTPVVTWPAEPAWLDEDGRRSVRLLAAPEPTALAACVREWTLDPAAAAALGARGRAWVDRHASAESLVDRYEGLYRRALRFAEPGEGPRRAEHAA
jgi:hypothetical protein